jgi:hypothetical protein
MESVPKGDNGARGDIFETTPLETAVWQIAGQVPYMIPKSDRGEQIFRYYANKLYKLLNHTLYVRTKKMTEDQRIKEIFENRAEEYRDRRNQDRDKAAEFKAAHKILWTDNEKKALFMQIKNEGDKEKKWELLEFLKETFSYKNLINDMWNIIRNDTIVQTGMGLKICDNLRTLCEVIQPPENEENREERFIGVLIAIYEKSQSTNISDEIFEQIWIYYCEQFDADVDDGVLKGQVRQEALHILEGAEKDNNKESL